jgi:hypothetical protein
MSPDNPSLFDDLVDEESAEYNGAALLAELRQERETSARLRGRIAELMRRISTPGRCKNCGQTVFWIKYASDKNAPYDDDGQIHFATCPGKDE